MSPRARFLDRRFHVLGASVSAPAAILIGTTLTASILAAQLARVAAAGVLFPVLVFAGEVWRLVTWAFFEQDAIGLIFAALAIFWFGNDLVRLWGPVRFLASYLGLAAAAAGLTCLLALAWPALRAHPFAGAWPVVSALIIAWASAFPTRNILLYFVVPLHGRNLIYATLGGTLLFALLGGSFVPFVPHFAAQLVVLAAMRGTPLSGLLAKVRFEVAYRRWRRRSSALHEVKPPPGRDEGPRWYH
jgi:membrane associated rhomboid family serine protease